ncbi:MAG TPA: head GIN domain-containing protein [Panacibacter sp.]|nr:head GIN domain-containing protein [Panacibacter sp.]
MQKMICSLCLAFVLIATSTKAQNLVYDANAQVRKVSDFNGVSVGSGIKLYLSQGKEQAVAVSADDAQYIERIITEVKDGVLKIRVESKMWNNWNWGNKKLKAYVTVTDLNFLGASGGSIAELVDEISVNKLNCDASGGSIIKGKLKGNSFNIDLSGGSIATLEGAFDDASIEASGGSIFKDYNLSIDNCNVEASGGSIINISINKTLKADASGGSIITYKGSGVITSVDASGGSSIKKKD